eukprot:gnl/TRDRNA2_/TRDRNA2_172764_c3_seq2.p1 gnl/TRDRNA2_/TRDRNA2_172764_c3~~gnl/TRDRNA2_/TRDRNA2_172764_c3_seq2.p1  ORF type:complete len:625 (+),score=96.13 gnl/TRDRNA2_/TRDRNA2_172764_c3_seq2:169-2043(+)
MVSSDSTAARRWCSCTLGTTFAALSLLLLVACSSTYISFLAHALAHTEESASANNKEAASLRARISRLETSLRTLQDGEPQTVDRMNRLEASLQLLQGNPSQSKKPTQLEPSCPVEIEDFSSKEAMVAAGWKWDLTDVEYGSTFFAWKSSREVGSMRVKLKGSGRLVLHVLNAYPEVDPENVVIAKMNGETVMTLQKREARKICLWFRDNDELSLFENYGQIRLEAAKMVCDSQDGGATPPPVSCKVGQSVQWGAKHCNAVHDGKQGKIVELLNESTAIVASSEGTREAVAAHELILPDGSDQGTPVDRTLSIAEIAAGLWPDNATRCGKFPFERKHIGLLSIADHQFQKSYHPHIISQRCYANWRGYDHFIFDNNDFPVCDKYRENFFFQKHCIVAEFLKTRPSDYVAVVVDGDVIAVVEERGVESWLQDNDDMIFYSRAASGGDEIAAGNYIARNTAFTRDFLMKWADWFFHQPQGFSSADNGAIHVHFLQTFKLPGAEVCAKMFADLVAELPNMQPYLAFASCAMKVLGTHGKYRVQDGPSGSGAISILSQKLNWVVDAGTTPATPVGGPVMYHGLKNRSQVSNFFVDLDRCALRNRAEAEDLYRKTEMEARLHEAAKAQR